MECDQEAALSESRDQVQQGMCGAYETGVLSIIRKRYEIRGLLSEVNISLKQKNND